MTPLQNKIVAHLLHSGASTAEQIAQGIGNAEGQQRVTTRGVAISANFLRGSGVINDGGTEYVWPSPAKFSCYHDGPRPIVWRLGPHEKVDGICPEQRRFAADLNAETAAVSETREDICP
jgi:hypothetical protein